MGFVVYVLVAIAVLIGLAWALYVAPTPGPLPLSSLAAAMLPALSILLLGGVLLLAVFVARTIARAIKRGHR